MHSRRWCRRTNYEPGKSEVEKGKYEPDRVPYSVSENSRKPGTHQWPSWPSGEDAPPHGSLNGFDRGYSLKKSKNSRHMAPPVWRFFVLALYVVG